MRADEDVLVAALTILISDISDFLNVGKNFSVSQIEQTIYILIESFPSYKIDDFVICFHRAKRGFYGKTYDRLDGMIIMEWLNQYDEERTIEIEQFRINEKVKLQSAIAPEVDHNAIPMPNYVKDFIKNIGKPFKDYNNLKVLSDEEYTIKKLIARWDRQFSNLFRKLGKTKEGYRFLLIKGIHMNLQEFLEYKMKNYSSKK